MPGIFKTTLLTRTDFNNPAINTNSYTAALNSIIQYNEDGSPNTTENLGIGNQEKRFSFQDKVDHPSIFSGKDFTCCTPLGNETATATRCCSGYGTLNSAGTKYTCKLPKGTDLNVYFNKFVSNEGVGDSQPGGGLTIVRSAGAADDSEVDFNPYTGEPKLRDSTYNKLVALGSAYCDGTVGTGGAFGAFPAEPFSGNYSVNGQPEDHFPVSIIDSVIDYQKSDPSLGKAPFDIGYRWNHHYYCK